MSQNQNLGNLGQVLTVNAASNTVTVNSQITVGNTNMHSTGITIGNTSLHSSGLTINGTAINTTSFAGTANNTLYVGLVTAANVVSNAQLQANVTTLQSQITSNASAAYTNAVSYTDTKIGTANTAMIANASAAYTNATVFASNASNVNTGTLAEARLPYRMNQNLRTSDNVEFTQMTLTGNLVVSGNVNIIGANNLSVSDNMIYLNANNDVTNPDVGVAANYNDGTYAHTGIFRDATDGIWKVFDNYTPEPDASVYIDTSNTSFHLANFQANTLYGGNTSTNWFVANTGGVYATGTVNAASHTVGSTFVANTSGLYHSVNTFNHGTLIYGNGSNVGIGTSTPSQKLTVVDSGSVTSYTYNQASSGTFNYAAFQAVSNGATNIAITAWGLGSARANTGWCQTVSNHPLVFGVNDSEVGRFDTSGNFLNSSSVRSPIFYDSDNTGYYVNPAGTSNMYQINAGGGTQIVPSPGSGGAWFSTAAYGVSQGDNRTHFGYNTGDNVNYVNYIRGAYTQIEASARSPIFYDSNDTGYYVDPASTSAFNAAEVYGAWHFRTNKGATVYLGSSDTPSLQAYCSDNGSAFMSFHRSGAYAVNMGLDPDNVLRIGGWSASANRWQLDMSGNQWVASSSRAPIFYDSDDTAYYVNPNGSSRINNIENNMQIFGGYGSGSGPGMTFENQSTFLRTAFFDWDFYDWNVGSILRLNSYAQSETSFRAPIFYDSNDTGYYLDPNSTSDQALRIRGGAYFGPNVSWGRYLWVGTNSRPSDEASVCATDGNLHIDSMSGHMIYLNYYSNANVYQGGSGFFYSGTSIRAPIFYDTDDTAYYANLAGASRLSGIQSTGRSGNWTTDFQNTPADTFRYGGDINGGTDCPTGGGWWVQQNLRHSNASNYWGVQVAWGWEDRAHELYTRNVTGNSFSSWIRYSNSNNGGRLLLATWTASNSAALSDSTIFSSASQFKRFKIVFENIIPATNGTTFCLRVYGSGAYQSASYNDYAYTFNNGGSAGYSSASYIDLSASNRVGNTTAWGGISGELNVYGPAAGYYTRVHGFTTFYDSGGIQYSDCVTISGTWNSTAAVTGFQVFMLSGNIASGIVKIYGVN